MSRTYQVHEFAELAGVTVRALHHYDRMGLLCPERTHSGYRAYNLSHLERLEQIVALRFVGIPLAQIRSLLDNNAPGLPGALRRQREVLKEKRDLLDRAIRAIEQAERSIRPDELLDAALLKQIIEVMQMENNTDWMAKYSNEAARIKMEKKREEWTPELQEMVSRQWADLYRDADSAANAGEDPAGSVAQALLSRWDALVFSFTKGDPDITQSVKNLYQDRENWPSQFKQQMAPFSSPTAREFIERARAARRTPSTNEG